MGINPPNRGVRVQSSLNAGDRYASLRQYRPVSRALRSEGIKNHRRSIKSHVYNFQLL